ncbi:MAG: hypothetical protein EPO42_07710 [Gallionellaceae bacterium]|nr:MAG: hypothetical protein EPO42_07710 [Gallionellaceae bacterium]
MSEDLCERLQDVNEAGAYRLSCPLAVLEANVALSGLTLFDADLAAVQGKGEFLARMAQVLLAPDWFGHNWDALADVLGDLSWQPSAGYVLLLCNGGEKLGLSDADYAGVTEIFNDTVRYWKARGKPFWVFFA